MKAAAIDRMLRYARHTCVALAVLYVAVYVAIALLRMPYPFELEWMEGHSLDQVRQILQGHKLYVAPTLEYAPNIYPPLYFYISAGLAKIIGLGFHALRLVSFAASLGSFCLIFAIVHRETGHRFAAALALGLYAATFRAAGAWFDVARVDSVFLVLLLGALYTIRFHTSLRSGALAGLLIFLSFLAKQMALVIALPAVLYCVAVDRRRALALAATLVSTTVMSALLLNHIHQGWYAFYIFRLPAQDGILKPMFLLFWVLDIIRPLSTAGLAAALYLVGRPMSPARSGRLFYLLSAFGMIGGSWAARVHVGGYENALMPAYAMIAILFGLGTHRFIAASKLLPASRRSAVELALYGLCAIQFAVLAYNPYAQVPKRRDLQAGLRLVETIERIEGDVLIPCHGYLAVLAGKKGCAHPCAAGELYGRFGGAMTEPGRQYLAEARRALEERRFAAVIVDTASDLHDIDVEQYYRRQGPVFESDSVFWPVTGAARRPSLIYVPRD